jgi:putative intracellular protease/amidase
MNRFLISAIFLWFGLTACCSKKSWWEVSDKNRTFDLTEHQVLFVLGNEFNFHEFAIVKGHLEKWGAEVKTVGIDQKLNGRLSKPTVVGWINSEYREFAIDMSISQVDLTKVDALFFPGGNSPEYLLQKDSLAVVSLIRDANKRGLTLAATCAGKRLFVSAGIIEELCKKVHSDVQTDSISPNAENLITATGPKLEIIAEKIARRILENDLKNQADRSTIGLRPNRVPSNAAQ